MALVAAASAQFAEVNREGLARILHSESETQPQGAYKFNYETENGIKVEEIGTPTIQTSEGASIAVRGSYSYTGPNGELITTQYIADENGFQAFGDHLPKNVEDINARIAPVHHVHPVIREQVFVRQPVVAQYKQLHHVQPVHQVQPVQAVQAVQPVTVQPLPVHQFVRTQAIQPVHSVQVQQPAQLVQVPVHVTPVPVFKQFQTAGLFQRSAFNNKV